MEEGSVVIVLEALVELLVPYHTFVALFRKVSTTTLLNPTLETSNTYSNINYFEEKRMSDHVLGQYHRPTDSGEVPFVLIWIVHVEPCDSDSDDIV